MQQAGTLSSTLTLNGIVPTLGSATLASVAAAASSPMKSFVDREAVSGQDGRIELTASRSFGVINIGAFPSGITAPAGFTYLLRMPAGYQDTVTSQAGTTTTVAPSTGAPTGNVSFWNGAGYTSLGPTAAGLNNLTSTATSAATISGRAVVVTISVDDGLDRRAGGHAPNESRVARFGPTSTRASRRSPPRCTTSWSSTV